MLIYGLNTATILLLALLLDAIFGDPDWLWRRIPHPVQLFGRLVERLERWLNLDYNQSTEQKGVGLWSWLSRYSRRDRGVITIGLLITIAGLAGAGLHWLFMQYPAGIAAEILCVAILIAQRSLYEHVSNVCLGFREGGIEAARAAVSMIVGRDPDALDSSAICRASIETTAENFSDGVVAPAFWYLLAGLPGILIYKAVNTADSMIGHRSPRYEQFGWASARLDDGLNLVPARLSALFIWVASILPDYNPGHAIQATIHDARKHRSPNAGWPEAAMAGALDLALAGPRQYASGPVDDAWMNSDGNKDARPADIRRALALFVVACRVHFGYVAIIAIAIAL